ncbi:LysR substrate-binding domain-containing protein [Roseibium sp.]|uniref:LysR substrate-binding domain-containing protein n=1 Tax=Roseibium sp. TaxID=1936156 RepID=UPI003A987603
MGWLVGQHRGLAAAAENSASPSVTYPNLRHLRLLEAAERQGSLTSAADGVHISQPAASQAISRLNSQFGGKLLERHGNGVFATDRGKIVIARTRRLLELIRTYSQSVSRRLRVERTSTTGTLESRLTVSHLKAMSYVGQAGNFSAAARALNQSEPSVQRAAREIEGIIGLQLFSGGLRRVQLTQSGLDFSKTASLILKELDSAFEEVREYDGAFDGRIVIGTLPLVRTRIVPDAVVALSAKHPDATIGVLDGTYEDLLQGLETGAVDVLIGALRGKVSHVGLSQKRLFDDRLAIVARRDHPLAGRGDVTARELTDYRWVLPRPGTPTRQLFEELVGDECMGGPKGVIETGSLVALRGILTQSDYLTIISPRQIYYELQSGLLEELQVGLNGSDRPIGLTTRADWQPTALQKDFLAALEAAIEAHS